MGEKKENGGTEGVKGKREEEKGRVKGKREGTRGGCKVEEQRIKGRREGKRGKEGKNSTAKKVSGMLLFTLLNCPKGRDELVMLMKGR